MEEHFELILNYGRQWHHQERVLLNDEQFWSGVLTDSKIPNNPEVKPTSFRKDYPLEGVKRGDILLLNKRITSRPERAYLLVVKTGKSFMEFRPFDSELKAIEYSKEIGLFKEEPVFNVELNTTGRMSVSLSSEGHDIKLSVSVPASWWAVEGRILKPKFERALEKGIQVNISTGSKDGSQ